VLTLAMTAFAIRSRADSSSVNATMVIDELIDHIADILRSGSPAQRKGLIEALVAEVKVTGHDTIIPVCRISQPPATNGTTPADTEPRNGSHNGRTGGRYWDRTSDFFGVNPDQFRGLTRLNAVGAGGDEAQ
jgi:hypothetical protein